MKGFWTVVWVFLLLFASYQAYTPSYAYMENATVLLEAYDSEGNFKGHGSGVILSDGYILTAGHVAIITALNPDFTIIARFRHGESSPTKLVAMDYTQGKRGDLLTDVALLKAETHDYRAATYSCGTQPVGTSLYMVGAPHDGLWVTTQGYVNSIVPRRNQEEGVWLQIDGSINPGNSGGPVFDHWGRVVGIVSHLRMTFLGPSGLSYAASGEQLCEFLAESGFEKKESLFGVYF